MTWIVFICWSWKKLSSDEKFWLWLSQVFFGPDCSGKALYKSSYIYCCYCCCSCLDTWSTFIRTSVISWSWVRWLSFSRRSMGIGERDEDLDTDTISLPFHRCYRLHQLHMVSMDLVFTHSPTPDHRQVSRQKVTLSLSLVNCHPPQLHADRSYRSQSFSLLFAYLSSIPSQVINIIVIVNSRFLYTAPTKAKSREPAYSRAFIQNKIDI